MLQLLNHRIIMIYLCIHFISLIIFMSLDVTIIQQNVQLELEINFLINYYNRIITFLVKDAQSRALEKGIPFDEDKCKRKMKHGFRSYSFMLSCGSSVSRFKYYNH